MLKKCLPFLLLCGLVDAKATAIVLRAREISHAWMQIPGTNSLIMMVVEALTAKNNQHLRSGKPQ